MLDSMVIAQYVISNRYNTSQNISNSQICDSLSPGFSRRNESKPL